MDVDPGLRAGVAEEGGQLRRVADVLVPGPAFGVAQDHMGAGHVTGVEPQVLGAGDGEGQPVVLARAAPHQHRQPARGQIVERASAGRRLPRPLRRTTRGRVQLGDVAGRQRRGLARERRLPLLARVGSPGLDLASRPLQPARLLEQPVGVRGAAEPGIDADPQHAIGVVGIAYAHLPLRVRDGCRGGEERLGLTAQLVRRRKAGEIV